MPRVFDGPSTGKRSRMNTLRAMGARMGGVIRATRAYFAVVPFVIPLLLISTSETPSAAEQVVHRFQKPPIDFASAGAHVAIPLPRHPGYVTVERGDTLDVLLESCGIDRAEANRIIPTIGRSVDLRSLRPGQMLRYLRDPDGSTQEVELLVTGWGRVRARRAEPGSSFAVEAVEETPVRIEGVVSGTIETSLWDAVVAAGEHPSVVGQLVDVFQWDVDFFGLQRGDGFSFAVEKRYVGPDFVGYGPIVAARFRHRGETYEAFHFEQEYGVGGYYTADGTPVRKQFLKSPLKFSRITSGFSHKRFHPVLKRFRPHYGVDYGAPSGTPVMSTADGVVTFVGRGSGEGNWIRVRHSSKIETAYLHLSRFAPNIRKGTKVRQGEVIGFVGATGLATAPHLDYRVRESGKWINPVGLRSITLDRLRGKTLREFESVVADRMSRLPGEQDLLVAGR